MVTKAEYNARLRGEEIARLCDKINRLRAAIERIDAINDNPARFCAEINEVCDAILRPHLYQQRGCGDPDCKNPNCTYGEP